MDAILDSLDIHGKKEAFENNFAKLQANSRLDLDILKICVGLLEPLVYNPDCATNTSPTVLLHEQLWVLLESRILMEDDRDYLCTIAQACLSQKRLAVHINEQIYSKLTRFLEKLTSRNSLHDEHVHEIKPYLRFLMCSFWLPNEHFHLVNPDSIGLLSSFIGIDGVDSTAHDALSALFSLIKTSAPLLATQSTLHSEKIDNVNPRHNRPVVDEALWLRLKTLPPKFFTSNTSKIFRTWFQWISQVVLDGVELTSVYDDLYWDRLRMGLVNGFADQRKYCLGIIHQSLRAARKDISTASMRYYINDRSLYLKAYQNFSTLFETIVLNRYLKQVEACLSELTTLFGTSSIIAPSMVVAMLTAALDPKIQEAIRKLVGNWYIKNVINGQLNADTEAHLEYLFEGLLPWAIEGSLFTSTLVSTRVTAQSTHGVALTELIATFASETPPAKSSRISEELDVAGFQVRTSRYRAVSLGVVRFISKSGNSIFKPSILYMLEGLIKGLEAHSEKLPLKECVSSSELHEIIGLSTLTGFPEIASDLFNMYCGRLCEFAKPDWQSLTLPGGTALNARIVRLKNPADQESTLFHSEACDDKTSLEQFLENLHASRVEFIQGANYGPACNSLIKFLDQTEAGSVDQSNLYDALEAIWDEAERRGFVRPVVLYLPPLLFHPVCIQTCILQHSETHEKHDRSLASILITALKCLQALSQSRLYVVAGLASSIRKAVLFDCSILDVLPIQDYIIDFINKPPIIRPEFLFEVAAAVKLHQILPHRNFSSYYGQREWHAYAAIIDLIQSLIKRKDIAKNVLDHLLEPWKGQTAPIPIKSPWKETLQLQVMLILSDFCVADPEINTYIDLFLRPLIIEPWPRYRHLLEWIIARMYCKSTGSISRQLDQIGNIDDYSPIHIASLIKLGLLVAPYSTEDFAINIATHLACFAASPKVQIRHEAQFAFPILFDLAEAKQWKSVTENVAFKGLNAFIRRLDKFKAAAWTIRTLKLNVLEDFTLTNIFQGQYLSIELPEAERVTREDFVALQAEGDIIGLHTARIPLGQLKFTPIVMQDPTSSASQIPSAPSIPASTQPFLQTKSSFDLNSLHPASGSPDMQSVRPSSVILVASLIDNPTNLGGLSRISESFGIESMYIDDLKNLGLKDFKATSVTSEKHLQIRELKEISVPSFLLSMKRNGYEVVGIEQTDRSEILGQEVNGEEKSSYAGKVVGQLPKKCVLVLGSEKQGISAEVLAMVDRCVEIKTVGVTRSLNVQTAGGIVLYEWWRIWGGGNRPPNDFTPRH